MLVFTSLLRKSKTGRCKKYMRLIIISTVFRILNQNRYLLVLPFSMAAISIGPSLSNPTCIWKIPMTGVRGGNYYSVILPERVLCDWLRAQRWINWHNIWPPSRGSTNTCDNSMRDEYSECWSWVWFYPQMHRMNYPSSTR